MFRVTLACSLLTIASGAALARDPACPFLDAPGPLLNSERIGRCFGGFGIEVLEPVEGLRIARLVSDSGGVRICRTLAVTRLEIDAPPELAAVMARIRAGGSIGQTLEKAGWQVGKTGLAITRIDPGERFWAWSGLDELPPGTPVAMHAYRLTASAGGRAFPIAHIAEFHHPDYLGSTDLERLHPVRDALEPADSRFLALVIDLLQASP